MEFPRKIDADNADIIDARNVQNVRLELDDLAKHAIRMAMEKRIVCEIFVEAERKGRAFKSKVRNAAFGCHVRFRPGVNAEKRKLVPAGVFDQPSACHRRPVHFQIGIGKECDA